MSLMTKPENRAMAAATALGIHHVYMVETGQGGTPPKGTKYRSLLDNLVGTLEKAATAEFDEDPHTVLKSWMPES